jgi:hypothetical protein
VTSIPVTLATCNKIPSAHAVSFLQTRHTTCYIYTLHRRQGATRNKNRKNRVLVFPSGFHNCWPARYGRVKAWEPRDRCEVCVAGMHAVYCIYVCARQEREKKGCLWRRIFRADGTIFDINSKEKKKKKKKKSLFHAPSPFSLFMYPPVVHHFVCSSCSHRSQEPFLSSFLFSFPFLSSPSSSSS